MLKRHGFAVVLLLILATVLACGGTTPPTAPAPTLAPPEPVNVSPCETDEGMAYLAELDAQVDLVLPAAEVLSDLLKQAASEPDKSDSILWKASLSAASRALVISIDGLLEQRAPLGIGAVEARVKGAATATKRAVEAYRGRPR